MQIKFLYLFLNIQKRTNFFLLLLYKQEFLINPLNLFKIYFAIARLKGMKVQRLISSSARIMQMFVKRSILNLNSNLKIFNFFGFFQFMPDFRYGARFFKVNLPRD